MLHMYIYIYHPQMVDFEHVHGGESHIACNRESVTHGLAA